MRAMRAASGAAPDHIAGRFIAWLQSEDLGHVNQSVAPDGECEARLERVDAPDRGRGEGAAVQNGAKRGEPGLVVVLGSEQGQRRNER